MRSIARSVLISESVKSSLNHEFATTTPSIVLVVLRAANSGCEATFVVWLSTFSCRAISAPSLVETRSGSTKSAPSSIASLYDASVCSGRYPLAPRWPITIGFSVQGGVPARATPETTSEPTAAPSSSREWFIGCFLQGGRFPGGAWRDDPPLSSGSRQGGARLREG